MPNCHFWMDNVLISEEKQPYIQDNLVSCEYFSQKIEKLYCFTQKLLKRGIFFKEKKDHLK